MSEKPNILLIMMDQQRFDCIGYSNKYPVETPNIDKLASRGVWFNNAYTPIPTCCPARQSLLTGKRCESFGALWNYDNGLKIPALFPSSYTYAKELKKHGYINALIGKWHVNPEHNPLEYGFDKYISTDEYLQYRRNKYPSLRFKNGFIGEIDSVQLDDTETHQNAYKTIALIKELNKQDKPWHISLNFQEPHLPCRPVRQFSDMYKPEDIPKWESFNDEFKDKPYIQKQQLLNWGMEDYTWEQWAPIVARYYGLITQTDDAIGRVLNFLDSIGQYENTIVIYTSDHGDMCGSHRMMDKHYVLYEDVIRVPLIVSWPDKIKEGKIVDEFVINCLDFAPTILDLVQIDTVERFHGKSFKPLLFGEDVSNWRQEVVSTYNGQQFGLFTMRMIRNNKWKYIWNTTDIDELYDIENDPFELNNLINDNSYMHVISYLRKKLYNQLIEHDDGLVMNPWLKSQLVNNRKLI